MFDDTKSALEEFGAKKAGLEDALQQAEALVAQLKSALGHTGIQDKLGTYGPTVVKWGKRLGLLAGGAGALEMGPKGLEIIGKLGPWLGSLTSGS